MHKTILALFITGLYFNCSTESNSQDSISNQQLVNDSFVEVVFDTILSLNDSTIQQSEETVDYGQVKDLSIYRFGYRKINGQNLGFVSMSEQYQWLDPPKTTIVDSNLLKKPSGIDYNYHEISADNRALFLKFIGVSESQKLFIFDYRQDVILEFHISDLPLVGILSPYTSERDFPVPEHYFMIGFEFSEEVVDKLKGSMTHILVSIDDENPFQKGKAEAIIWNEVDFSEYPKDENEIEDTAYSYLKYSYDDYEYYTMAVPGRYYTNIRVKVIHVPSGEQILDQVYGRGEGASATSVLTPRSENPYNQFDQWTGYLFKGQPPVLIGLENQSFGCEPIDFLDEDPIRVYPLCDNRH